jgi:hypothetical protein
LLQLELHPFHLPRSFNAQDASIEFVILHACDFLMSVAASRKGRVRVPPQGSFPIFSFPSIAEQVQSGPQQSRARRFSGAAEPTLTARTALKESSEEGRGLVPGFLAHSEA